MSLKTDRTFRIVRQNLKTDVTQIRQLKRLLFKQKILLLVKSDLD